jgi:hypothetical protein
MAQLSAEAAMIVSNDIACATAARRQLFGSFSGMTVLPLITPAAIYEAADPANNQPAVCTWLQLVVTYAPLRCRDRAAKGYPLGRHLLVSELKDTQGRQSSVVGIILAPTTGTDKPNLGAPPRAGGAPFWGAGVCPRAASERGPAGNAEQFERSSLGEPLRALR